MARIARMSDDDPNERYEVVPIEPTEAGQYCPLSDHLADNRRHVRCRESSQRFGADVAERAKAQVKRHGGRLIWRFDDCHDVIPSLRPEDVLHGHSKRLRHLLEGICPLRGILSVADSLVGELRKHDISYHGHPPWLGPCATWHEEVVLCRLRVATEELPHRLAGVVTGLGEGLSHETIPGAALRSMIAHPVRQLTRGLGPCHRCYSI